jgi:hypothetical protein
MNDDIISTIVNRYANHVLPEREWTEQEKEEFNNALREYGWR